MGSENMNQLVVNNLDDLLAGRKRGENFLPHRLLLDVLDKLLYYAEMHVGLEQSDTDLAQSGLHVLGRQFAFAAQVLENALQLVG